jgi:hypothetical protein
MLMELSVYDLMYLKEQHEGHKIIYVLFNNREFVFRTLTRKEYRDILNITSDDYEFEDAICQSALVFPEDFDFSESPLGGLSHNVAPTIIEVSGFTNLQSVINMYEESKSKVLQFDQECMAVIKAAMPEHTYEEMEDWTWEKLTLMVARAERILHLKGHDINMVSKQEEAEEHAAQITPDNKEFIKELRENGIDPMNYFKDVIIPKKDFVDFPLIGGIHWQNEGVMDAIREQMEKAKTAKR